MKTGDLVKVDSHTGRPRELGIIVDIMPNDFSTLFHVAIGEDMVVVQGRSLEVIKNG